MAEETLEVLITLMWLVIPITFAIGIIRQSLGEQETQAKHYENSELDLDDNNDDDLAA